MNSYYPSELPVPAELTTERLHLEPLRPEHVQLDFEAVVESRDQLRLWEGGDWPADDFTVADNLRDLQRHWREHQERVAFTYTVLNPVRDKCLGCVYMRPLAELALENQEQLSAVAPDETIVRFWIRSSLLDEDLERHLLDTLDHWFEQEWSFSRVLYETRESNGRQVALFDAAPLKLEMALEMPNRGGRHLFYHA